MPETIYDALRESHDIQRSLCRKLLRSKPGTQVRQQVFTALRIELAAHAASEERYLYVPILMHDMGLMSSRHALAEHHEIDEIIEEMQALGVGHRGWMAKAKKLSAKVHHHLKEEEKKFFQVSGRILSDAQKTKLAKQYRKDYLRMHASLSHA
jgi:hypothetical protein